jgi:hypothetical protein
MRRLRCFAIEKITLARFDYPWYCATERIGDYGSITLYSGTTRFGALALDRVEKHALRVRGRPKPRPPAVSQFRRREPQDPVASIRENLWNQEGGRRGHDPKRRHRAMSAVVEHERPIGNVADANLTEAAAVGDDQA